MKVYFKNSNGELRSIGTVENEKAGMRAIREFLKVKKFTCYYQRTWDIDFNFDGYDKAIKVDVGSHTEFFYIAGGEMKNLRRESK